MFRRRQRTIAQSTLEYMVLIIVAIGAFLGVQNYFKRGVAGRWKSAVDDLGDQYDPRLTNSSIRHTIRANSVTIVTAINVINGYWTLRSDDANMIETKTGFMTVGSE